MKQIVVAFSYVNYQNHRRQVAQNNAIRVLATKLDNVSLVSFGFKGSESFKFLDDLNIPHLKILERDSSKIVGGNRHLPYIKEILNYCSMIKCDVFGYINSDILIPLSVYDILQSDFNAFMFPRYDIAEVDPQEFMSGKIKIIYGGNTHVGVDSFFFNKGWWLENRDNFHDDLIIGETEWDTYYRLLIKNLTDSYMEKRLTYHVYHDPKWDIKSPGGINNKKILEGICQ